MGRKMKTNPDKPTNDPGTQLMREEQDRLLVRYSEAEKVLGERYDYDRQVAATREDLTLADIHRVEAVRRALSAGKRLRVIRGIEQDGKYEAALEKIGVVQQRAHELMRLHEKLGDAPALQSMLDAGAGKRLLQELSRLPDEKLDEVRETGLLDGDPVERKSSREVRDYCRKLLSENERQKGKIATGEKQLAAADARIAAMERGAAGRDDAEIQAEVVALRDRFDAIVASIALFPVEDLSPQTILHIKALFLYIGDGSMLAENRLAERTEAYGRLGWKCSPGQLQTSIDTVYGAYDLIEKGRERRAEAEREAE